LRTPSSTYRWQFNKQFTFRDALELTEYLHELGISDCYASPVFRARPDSSHGYDICDFNELSPVLGTSAEFDRWTDCLRNFGMGLLLDMVPNHMGADPGNPWWRDVLEKGEASKYAGWFDINWHPPDENLQGKVLLPILEDEYYKVLEAGKLRIQTHEKGLALAYGEFSLPLSGRSHDLLLAEILKKMTYGGAVAAVGFSPPACPHRDAAAHEARRVIRAKRKAELSAGVEERVGKLKEKLHVA
jgi:(1->4)-alpha-D-glucan 1-alpha-D-glucosylmutase